MPEGLDNERYEQNVKDLLAEMSDPIMVAVMHQAVVNLRKHRTQPCVPKELEGEVGRKMMLISAGALEDEDAGPGFFRTDDGRWGVKLSNPQGDNPDAFTVIIQG